MAYDSDLADRIRTVLHGEPGLGERRMFGGLAFLLNGNMAVCASNEGGLLLRVQPEKSESLIDREHVRRFTMQGREMKGWLYVEVDALTADDELRRYVHYGLTCARSLAPR